MVAVLVSQTWSRPCLMITPRHLTRQASCPPSPAPIHACGLIELAVKERRRPFSDSTISRRIVICKPMFPLILYPFHAIVLCSERQTPPPSRRAHEGKYSIFTPRTQVRDAEQSIQQRLLSEGSTPSCSWWCCLRYLRTLEPHPKSTSWALTTSRPGWLVVSLSRPLAWKSRKGVQWERSENECEMGIKDGASPGLGNQIRNENDTHFHQTFFHRNHINMPEQPTETPTPTSTPVPPPRAYRPKRRWTWSMGMGDADIEKQHAEDEIVASADVNTPMNPARSPEIITRNNFADMPPGWCLLAREQDWYHNGSLHRRFGWLYQLCLYYKEGKIGQLEKQLLELAREDQAQNEEALHSLTPWQLGVESEELGFSSERDRLMHEVERVLTSYGRTVKQALAINQAHKVSRGEATNLLQQIEQTGVLDEEAAWHFRGVDDMIKTWDSSEATPGPVDSLVYADKGSLRDFIMKAFVNKKKPEGSTWGTHYNLEPIKQVFIALSAAAVLLILLAPIGFLYFVEPSKPISFSVVAIFAIAAAWLMMKLPGIKIETVFIAAAAYMAVQVTFLANFQGASS
ncbi:hypothetical protein B0T14DRAFT_114428 [Immersiella caudata]|uniref:DUF6594 domain-containing protein n=1 Tax=Immersiella caudata TaxID=314043 RepID=A0AA40C6B0_9PEZI|nr:hypothetical protein B0T14DRAFT_114428 [Immersiella caudata]